MHDVIQSGAKGSLKLDDTTWLPLPSAPPGITCLHISQKTNTHFKELRRQTFKRFIKNRKTTSVRSLKEAGLVERSTCECRTSVYNG
jgi:hypothetical protein